VLIFAQSKKCVETCDSSLGRNTPAALNVSTLGCREPSPVFTCRSLVIGSSISGVVCPSARVQIWTRKTRENSCLVSGPERATLIITLLLRVRLSALLYLNTRACRPWTQKLPGHDHAP